MRGGPRSFPEATITTTGSPPTSPADGKPPEQLAPRLADGVELLGQSEDSGFKNPPSLVRRGDGQIIQLTPLLYLVASQADGDRDHQAIAEKVSEKLQRGVSADNVRTLVDDKLRPLGILAAADGSSPKLEKPDPLLALKFRKAIIPEHLSMRVASLFKPLFFPPVVLLALGGLVAFDAWLFLDHGVAQGFREAIERPGLMLPVLALVIVSAGWHEFGHAAGCAYGGACPGAMGAGIYLVYPAFYTDVTDSYRLGRRGRLRTDLAGVYFNGLFILAMAGLYAVTGFEPLLLVILFQHIEAAHQLLPILRLDGYYVLADLTGVPDMFSRIKPILASMIPGRKPDSRVTELKTWVRLVVTAWVLVVIPLLVFQLVLILLHAPRIFATAWESLGRQREAITAGFGEGDVLAALAGVLQSLILIVPVAGIVLTVVRLGGRVARGAIRTTEGKPVARAVLGVGMFALVGGLVYTWLPNGDYRPIGKGERGTLPEGIRAIRHVPTGRPSLVVAEGVEPPGEPDDPATTGTVPPPATSTTGVDARVKPAGSKTSTTVGARRVPAPVTAVTRTTSVGEGQAPPPTGDADEPEVVTTVAGSR